MEDLGGLRKPDPSFWRAKRVLVTGHTGFKGSWLALWLKQLGADVTGLSLPPETTPSMYALAGVEDSCVSVMADIRDFDAVLTVVATASPQIVIHMAAQSLVKVGMEEPVRTFSTNVMGTVNVLEALLQGAKELPEACVVVTSDKVYARTGAKKDFVEDDPLGGDEPYSASKAATEMVVASYRQKFNAGEQARLVTARGGNVIGGGDFSRYRLVPDIWRSCHEGKPLKLRMPQATRPWQHVLDCLAGYLLYAETIATCDDVPLSLNFGPQKEGVSVLEVARLMHGSLGKELKNELEEDAAVGEHQSLSLDSSLARKCLGWSPKLDDGLLWEWTAEWYGKLSSSSDMNAFTQAQIEKYSEL